MEKKEIKFSFKEYDWRKILYSLTPTFLIAIGAGMSIPFVPLFFEHTFNMNYSSFAGYGFLAYFLNIGTINPNKKPDPSLNSSLTLINTATKTSTPTTTPKKYSQPKPIFPFRGKPKNGF